MTAEEATRINLSRQVNRTGLPEVKADDAAPQSTPPDDSTPDWVFLLNTQRELREQDRLQHEAKAATDKAEIERLQGLLQAVDQRPSRWESKAPAHSISQLESQIGATKLHHSLTRSEKLSAMGLDPTLSDAFLDSVFGHKADSAKANDLFKENPARYRQLREAHKLLNHGSR